MLPSPEKSTIVMTRVHPRLGLKNDFLNWQTHLHTVVAAFAGFVSLETILSAENQNEWIIVQRFNTDHHLTLWLESNERKQLMQELSKFTTENGLQDKVSDISNFQGGVTEVFVTQVSPDKQEDYREWIAKIHQVEAKFLGFKGTYVQAPSSNQGGNWMTLLQFDTPEHLDHWLQSPERHAILKEGSSLITSLENHRVISPYAGWFSSISKEGKVPPTWKQAMIVLLVLFPIVMLEFKFLNPLTQPLNISLSTFIGNVISVALLSWPMVPIAIRLLRWWLVPKGENPLIYTIIGTILIFVLYILEIILFWNFL